MARETRCSLEDRVERCDYFLESIKPRIATLEKAGGGESLELLTLKALRNDLLILKREAGELMPTARQLELTERQAAVVSSNAEMSFQNHKRQIAHHDGRKEFEHARRWTLQAIAARLHALEVAGYGAA
jgi:hypothetical protein